MKFHRFEEYFDHDRISFAKMEYKHLLGLVNSIKLSLFELKYFTHYESHVTNYCKIQQKEVSTSIIICY